MAPSCRIASSGAAGGRAGEPHVTAAEPREARLPEPLVERVIGRLGLARRPEPTLAGLDALYGAWCARVPFDNVRKVIALRTEPAAPLPGMDAADFFEHWLAHGTGGTCWPSSNALFALVDALGFRARRVAGSMRDMNVLNHGTVKVRIDDVDWLVDTSMHTRVPLPLDERVHRLPDPVGPVEVEPSAVGEPGSHLVWFEFGIPPAWLVCRLLEDPVDHAFHRERFERSREQSPFNGAVTARLSPPGELRSLRGSKWHRRCLEDAETRELTVEEMARALIEEIGLSEAIVDAWQRCGGATAPIPPPPATAAAAEPRLPPSLRATAC